MMTLTKAIAVLDRHYVLGFHVDRAILNEAARLGIEAMKAVKECRASHMFCPGLMLPGETAE